MRAIPHFAFEYIARALALALIALLAAGSGVSAAAERPVSGQDRIVFFPSLASPSKDDSSWSVTIQGRVYEPPEGSPGAQTRLDTFALALLLPAAASDPTFRKRAGLLLSESERDRRVSIKIAGREIQLKTLSKDAGVFIEELTLTDKEVAKYAPKGELPFESVGTAESAKGTVYVLNRHHRCHRHG